MTYLQEWIGHCTRLTRQPAAFYSGARKILRGTQLVYGEIDDSIQPEHAGYTKMKMGLLQKLYLHVESRDVALELWDKRLGQGKYGSVGFTCYNHLIKADPTKQSKRASTMGPCLQSIVLTLLPSGRTSVDVFYRTTELFKKYPADLVFIRDTLLSGFDIDLEDMTHHIANLTAHPQYYVTIIPHQRDPIRDLEKIKAADPFFFNWIVKWTARYLVAEYFRGIEKHAQSMRVKMDADKRVTGNLRDELVTYLNANHPGYRNDYVDPDGDDE